MSFFFPLESFLRQFRQDPSFLPIVVGMSAGLLVLIAVILWVFRKYFTFVFKSLRRNLLRTTLTSLATMVLVAVVIMIWSILAFLDIVMTEKSKDLKAIVTERWQIPSQMPYAYASSLEQGAARSDDPYAVRPEDSMTWQFFGGTLDPTKRTRENIVFFFAMDPRKLRSMMDDLQDLDQGLIQKMVERKNGVLIGRERLKALNKQVGERFVLTSFNYKDVVLEFEIVGQLPEGRYDQSAVMNRDYLNDALDAWPRTHNGQKHEMMQKTLNLVWLRVPDSDSFRKMADQIMTSTDYSSPAVKCETASSGISSFLDAYKDLIWGMKWLLVPAILVTMALVIANAISISVRERRTEMAVLKVLGYSPGHIMAFVLGEALLVGAGSGLIAAGLIYLQVHHAMGGIKFPIAFFPIFDVYIDALWWGLLFGGATSLAGSFLPAWSARSVKVSEVFAKIG